MTIRYDGKVAIVTGAGNGLGRSHALVLAARGAKVVVNDLGGTVDGSGGALTAAETVVKEIIAAGGEAIANGANVTKADEVEAMVKQAMDTWGRIDILVNNAGIAGPTGNLEDLSPDDWRRCMDVCLTSQFLCSRQAIPMIKASGGGTIVNMASAAAKHGYAYRTPYSAAKFGVVGLTQSLAKELGPDNIRVNAVLPGIIEGPRMEGVIRDRAEATGFNIDAMRNTYLKNISLRRMTSPKDVATTVAFLVSDLGFNLSGQSLGVDGNVETL